MLAEWWTHGFNDLRVVKKGINKFVIKYLGKYVTKAIDDVKSLNQSDIGVKAYGFSRNCKNPLVHNHNFQIFLDYFDKLYQIVNIFLFQNISLRFITSTFAFIIVLILKANFSP